MPKKSLICVLAMTSAMPLVKPMTTGRGMKRTAVPVPVRPMIDQDDAGHHRAHEQAVDAVLGDDAGHDDDERAGRPADLHVRAAERRDDEAGDDRAVDAGLRRHARGDRERHGQRQRDEADRDAGDQIRDEQLWRVVAEREDRRGQKPASAGSVYGAMRVCWFLPICTSGRADVEQLNNRTCRWATTDDVSLRRAAGVAGSIPDVAA